MRLFLWIPSLMLVLAVCGCGGGSAGSADAGPDAGIDAGEDSGAPDAGGDPGGDTVSDGGGDQAAVGDPGEPDAGRDAGGDPGPVALDYDVVVVGAGTGGFAAALQAARLGVSAALVEECDWVGGQMTAAAVSTMDEGHFNDDAGIYIEFFERVVAHYAPLGKDPEVCGIGGTGRGVEPHVARQILLDMLATEPGVDLILRTRVTDVISSGDRVTGLEAVRTTGAGEEPLVFTSRLVVDATEYGDLLPLSPARYRVGNTSSDAIDPDLCVQDNTYTCTIRRYPQGVPPGLLITSPPPGTTQEIEDDFAAVVAADGNDWRETGWGHYPVDWLTHVAYRSVPDSASPDSFGPREFEKMTRTGVNWANDFDTTVEVIEDRDARRTHHCRAKLHTIRFLYYMQQVLGEDDWAIADDQGFDSPWNLEENLCDIIPPELKAVERHFPPIPYVRESRRMIGLETLTAGDIRRIGDPPRAATRYDTSLAVGDYPVDLHDCNTDATLELALENRADIPEPNRAGPFQIPFGVFIPETADGFLCAEKNLSYSRLAAGACRLQPVTMHTGQAVGVLAALAVQRGVQPRELDPVRVQWKLLEAGARLGVVKYADVPLAHERWREVELATVHGIFTGYPDGRFGVDDELTRAQAAVVLARLFGLATDDPPPDPSFEDVPSDHWAYPAVEACRAAEITAGCSADPPRYCPDDPATRAQLAVFVIRGLGLDPADASGESHYTDVPASHPMFGSIQLAADRGLLEECPGTPGAFCPDDPAGRGFAASVAARVLLHLHP